MSTTNLYLLFIKIFKRLCILELLNFSIPKVINGHRVKIPFINGMGINNLVIKTDWLDSLILEFIKKDNTVIVDVGVNIGQTILKVKTLHPGIEYLGFEPNPACIYYTGQLIYKNQFGKCTIYNSALSGKTGILTLGKNTADDPAASVIPSLRPEYFKNNEQVITIDYDSFFLDKKISFIKIDVEGAELDVISGMKQSIIKHKPLIVCEVLDSHNSAVFEYTQTRATELFNLLLSINYSIIRLHTNKIYHKIISFQILDELEIRQWTPQSYELNDYLFYLKI